MNDGVMQAMEKGESSMGSVNPGFAAVSIDLVLLLIAFLGGLLLILTAASNRQA